MKITFRLSQYNSSFSTMRVAILLLFVLAVAYEGTIVAQEVTDKSKQLSSYLEQGRLDISSNLSAAAAVEFKRALQIEPKNVEANMNLGTIDFLRGNCLGAENELKTAISGDSNLTKARVFISICEKRLGQRSAQADLEKEFSNLDNTKLRTMVGVELSGLYYENGDIDRAASVLLTLLKIDPDNVDILYFAQRVYTDVADATLKKLALIAPDSARMQQVIAEKLVNSGKIKDSIPFYKKAVQQDPYLPGIHYELAEAILESSPNDARSQQEALQELLLSIKVDGVSSNVESEWARIDYLQNHLKESFVKYKKALEINPNSEDAQMGVARLLMEQDKPQGAIGYLEKVVESDPMNAEAHYRLAMAYKNIHLFGKAKEQIHIWNVIVSSKKQVEKIYHEMDQYTLLNNKNVDTSEQ